MAKWGDLIHGQVTPPSRKGKGQGYFRYYYPDGRFHAIVAVNGKLLRNGGDLPIQGLPNGFQTDRMIEAVQWRDKLYIATGSGLVEYDGSIAKLVDPYQPKALEVLYIGTNALHPTPDQFVTDSEGTDLRIEGVTIDKRYGLVNEETTFNVFITKPATMTVKYAIQYKKKDAQTYVNLDGTTSPIQWQDSKTFKFKPQEVGEYSFKFLVKNSTETDDTKAVTYYIPVYKVTEYNQNKPPETHSIGKCNRILLHWDRLILYGDPDYPNRIYVSHLNNPAYFPFNNFLEFETDKREPLTKIVQYRDFLVAFTPSTIQALYGTNPQDYMRVKLNTSIGCIAPESACVFGNWVAFLSKDGVYILKSVGVTESRINVEKIDKKIANLIPPYPESGDACGIAYRDQYHICFPSRKMRFRFYRDTGQWARDESPYFDFCRMDEIQGDLVVQSQSTGEVYQFKDGVYDDLGYVYEDRIETKAYDFGVPYNPKKLREVQILVAHEKSDVNLGVYVYGDNVPIIEPEKTEIDVENGIVQYEQVYETNVASQSGTIFGEWQLGEDPFGEAKSKVLKVKLKSGGKYYNVRVAIKHSEPEPYTLQGVGFIFKLKSPK